MSELHLYNILAGWKLLFFNPGMTDPLNITDLEYFSSGHQCHGFAFSSGTSGSSNPVNIIFNILRYIIIKDSINTTYINSTGCHISRDQNSTASATEQIHYRISLKLGQISVKSFCFIAPSL